MRKLLGILLISLVFIQCKKEQETSSKVFWIPGEQAAILKASGVDHIKIYLDTTHIGDLSMSSNFTEAPMCGDAEAVTFEAELDEDYTYFMTIMSPDTSFIVEEQIVFNDEGCRSFNIVDTED